MPGRRLSHEEEQLLNFWSNPPAQFDKPLLRQLRIEGGGGIRGVSGLVVTFPYPLTVICGRNGVGKSTVLALAALSARSPANWNVYWGNTRPRTRPTARPRYEFKDFFHRQQGVPRPDGLRLTWVLMDHGNETEFASEMKDGRWVNIVDAARHRRPNDRPLREIDYVPMSRILPASELGALRSAFEGGESDRIESLNGETLQQLSYVMGRSYAQAETKYLRGLGLSSCRADAEYSGFDMGSGENSLIVLLSRLQNAPRGCLIVIEEIELGLHPEAQHRLMKILIQHCIKKKLQIICTTHSEVIIDSAPRLARVLLRKSDQEHEAISNVSTRFALYEMSGQVQPELMIYTEDALAGLIVGESLAGSQLARIVIRDIGSNATLARQSIAHMRMAPQLEALSVFDGDCAEAQVIRWINDERADRALDPKWLILPGDGLAPERWLVRELGSEAYREALSRELNCPLAIATAHVQAMRVQINHHDCGYILAERTGMAPDAARRAVVRAVARTHPALQALRDRVNELLDNRP